MQRSCPWAGFVRADDVGCEPDLCAWIVHPAEAWSNLAFFAVAAVLLARYGRAFWHVFSALSLLFVYRYERQVEQALVATPRSADQQRWDRPA
jgi:hypothetical protein